MTTPNYPWATTTAADLPQGVSMPSQQATVLQDQSQGKYTDLADSRFPSIAKGTSAGSPTSVTGPLGFVTHKVSGLVSRLANADPATVTKPEDIVKEAGGFFSGLPLISWLDDLFKMLTGNANGLTGLAATIANLIFLRWDQLDRAGAAAEQAKTQAQGALDAAKAADRKVTALLQGGTRTVYTSNTTWSKQANLVKIRVILCSGGRKGLDASFDQLNPNPGGQLITAEYFADQLPDNVSITIGAGSTNQTVNPTSFGAFLSTSSAGTGGGELRDSLLHALSADTFPGYGGGAANVTGTGDGQARSANGVNGGTTALAAGGAGGVSGSPHGKPGGNSPVDGQFLSGGAGGGGGYVSRQLFGIGGNGGAGGFPGGSGGHAGRNGNEAYWVGGAGAPGFAAIVEFYGDPE